MKDIHRTPKLTQLDLNLLHLFDVVYRERSLSRAAPLLSLTQPAVSHAMARLREQLDDPLFVPHGRGVAPTPLADRLAPSVRAALSMLEESISHLREFDPARDVQRLTIAMHDELEVLFLPRAAERFRSVAPQIRMSSRTLDRVRTRSELAQGTLDLVLDIAQPPEAEIQSELLIAASWCVLAAKTRRKIDFAVYLAARHAAVLPHIVPRSIEDLSLVEQGYHRQIDLYCQRFETAARIVASSDLLLTLPRPYAELLATTIPVRIVDLALPIPSTAAHMYWHKRRDADPVLSWLREQVRNIFVEARSTTPL